MAGQNLIPTLFLMIFFFFNEKYNTKLSLLLHRPKKERQLQDFVIDNKKENR